MTALRIAVFVIAGGLTVYNATGFLCEHVDEWLARRRAARGITLSTKCPRPDRSARR